MDDFTNSADYGLTPAQAAKELLRRRRGRATIEGFAQVIDIPGVPISPEDAEEVLFNPIESPMVLHHKILCREIQRAMETDYGRLMIFFPPGAAKSTYGTVVGPTWFMGKYPGSEIILGSHNIQLAKKHGSRGRFIVQQPRYQAIWGATLKPGSTAKEEWYMTNGSSYLSFGMLSGATGNRADGLVIDDPTRGRKDAESKTVMGDIINAYNDDLKTRLKPRAWIIIIQTRWAYEDLAGSILPEKYDDGSGEYLCRDGMKWRVLNIPAKNVYPHVADPLGRPVGPVDPAENGDWEKAKHYYLWPEWFDQLHWTQFEPRPDDPEGPSEKSWASLYQQRPRPQSGNQFEREWVNWYDLGEHPKYLMLFSASDYALGEEEENTNPDYTEHGIAGLDQYGDMWIVDWWYGKHTPDITIDALLTLAKRHNVKVGFGEVGLIQKAIEPQFKQRQRIRKYWMRIKYLPTISNKVARFQSFRAVASSGKLHIPRCPWGERLVDQLCLFPDTKTSTKDDGVDVCSLFGRGLEGMVWSRDAITEPRKEGVEFGSWEWLTMGTEKARDYSHLIPTDRTIFEEMMRSIENEI